ncbi:MAG: Na/Pi cotransporter family protein, partial [Planctomycetes bacterium]|nr:Na/Pi cotransporter family protein [Planctomycetota bacterium]
MDVKVAIEIFFGVIGGLGIFLLGMKNMSEGMQAVAGEKLRRLINAVTNNRILACGVGTVMTMLVQSSSITTVMVIGMVNAGIMNLVQAIGVILGANIGTTITGWILVIKIGKYGLPLLGISALFFLFSKRDRVRYVASFFLGLGMIFFGLQLMKNGFAPLKELPEFTEWFSRFSPHNYFGVLKCCMVGAILTAIVQSSSATLGITISLAYIGVIDYPTAAALVLGENIGTTITAYLASLGASSNAKRASYAHMVINIIGVLWITAVFSAYTALIIKIVGTDPGTGIAAEDGGLTYPFSTTAIAATHTGFNVVNVLIFLPFIGWLNKLLYFLVPEKAHKEVPHLRFIDVRMLDTPAISIQQSRKEVLRMGEHVEKMLSRLRLVIVDDKPNEKSESKIFHREEVLDIVQKEIVEFLTDLLSGTVPHDVMNSGRMQLRMADEYESISDYLTNILKLKLKLRDSDLKMTDAARREILDLHEHVS